MFNSHVRDEAPSGGTYTTGTNIANIIIKGQQ